jgi:two-component system, response regulator YesN
MRKILLVDDEIMVRAGIKALIQRSDLSDIEIFESDNGKKALEILELEEIDIAIVDIQMPVMDGITLIEMSQRIENKPEFIILSGYDDFKYAKSAMKYGVKYYLLKPVDRIEFIDAIKAIHGELLQLGEMDKEKNRVNTLIGEVSSDEINYILLSRNLNREKVRKALNRIKCNIFENKFSFLAAYVDKMDTLNSNDCLGHLETILNTYFTENHKRFINFYDEKGNYIIVCDGEIDSSVLNKYLMEGNLKQFMIGISCQGEGVIDIHKSYDQAYDALKYRVLRGTQCLISYSDISNLVKDFKVSVDEITKVLAMIGLNKIDEISRIISTIFSYEDIHARDIKYVEKTVESIKHVVIDKFNDITEEEFELNYGVDCNKFENIYNFKSLNEYIVELKNYLIHLDDYIAGINKKHVEKSSIRIAMQWINENYQREDLSMVMVANQVSLNYSYFSLAFKEFAGMNFVNYLRKVRIGKAKELLREKDAKVNLVAQKVGYPNPRQFTKSFKEEVGISPMDYINGII